MIDAEDILKAVSDAMKEDNEALLEQTKLPRWLQSVFAEVEELLAEVAGPTYRYMSKEDIMEGLGISYEDVLLMAQIGARLQLIAGNIDSRKPPKFKVIKNG